MRRTLVAAALLALVAGCGETSAATEVASVKGTAAAPEASARPTASVDPEEQGRKFAQCMRDHGIDMPDPESEGGGIKMRIGSKSDDRAKVDKAMEACRSLAPFGEKGPELTPEQQERMRAFTQCMRDNGVDMPDPDFGGGGGGGIRIGGPDSKLKPDDPKVQKAMESCRDKMGPVGSTK